MTPDEYECRTCHHAMYVPDGMDPLEEDVRYCESCAIDEIERLRTEIAELRPTGTSAVFDDYCATVSLVHRFADGSANLVDRVAAALDEIERLTRERAAAVDALAIQNSLADRANSLVAEAWRQRDTARRSLRELGSEFSRVIHDAKFLYRMARIGKRTPCISYLEEPEPQS